MELFSVIFQVFHDFQSSWEPAVYQYLECKGLKDCFLPNQGLVALGAEISP